MQYNKRQGVKIMWHDILMIVIGFIAGGVLGFFLSRMFMEKYLTKNPPINEEINEVSFKEWNEKNTKSKTN